MRVNSELNNLHKPFNQFTNLKFFTTVLEKENMWINNQSYTLTVVKVVNYCWFSIFNFFLCFVLINPWFKAIVHLHRLLCFLQFLINLHSPSPSITSLVFSFPSTASPSIHHCHASFILFLSTSCYAAFASRSLAYCFSLFQCLCLIFNPVSPLQLLSAAAENFLLMPVLSCVFVFFYGLLASLLHQIALQYTSQPSTGLCLYVA